MVLVKMFDVYFMIVMLMGLGFTIELSNGHKFYVGETDGWVLSPSEDYIEWSHRHRFQVNDTLYGDSLFQLRRSGPFFFISGDIGNCLKGQKLALTVMSTDHHRHTPRHPSPSPSPSTSLVHQALSSPAPSPGVDPSSGAPAPASGPAAAAHNSAGSVGPGVVSLGLILVIMISSMV
ncbi:PREDICTED: early nodulin-like protein 1 isoform X2 [Camelina sativa]|uniref:Early nodulin-like protein 1 isoform X2 n=1 Tax=Camelina sativa TaxID=90675 RepID=A0ABM0UWJ1_CAMSA|nr:PREDICTED: early nodulin-like protein 1 isoform X2 [Camelina sativa]